MSLKDLRDAFVSSPATSGSWMMSFKGCVLLMWESWKRRVVDWPRLAKCFDSRVTQDRRGFIFSMDETNCTILPFNT
jgi:hypothetical protein